MRKITVWGTGLVLALTLFLLSELSQAVFASSTIIYVDANVAASADGSSWEQAYKTLQEALGVTNVNPGTSYEIWVAAGVYYPYYGGDPANNRDKSFRIERNNVQLYGGFATTETLRSERDWIANPTILSGDIDHNDTTVNGVITHTDGIIGTNAYHVLWLDGVLNEPITSTTVIDGFTITAGEANGNDVNSLGGGLYCDGNGSECSPILTHVAFSGNSAQNGGGMYNNGSSNGISNPMLTYVTFSGNSASDGGGVYNDGNNGTSSPVLINVTFSDNSAQGGGGMLNCGRDSGISSPTLTNVVFSGNIAISGGGMYNYSFSNPMLTNVVFSGNQAIYGGGMINDGHQGASRPVLTNVTFSGNKASSYGGGIFNLRSSQTLVNCIVWGNIAVTDGSQIFDTDVMSIITYSNVQGGYAGIGNLNVDPQFVAPISATAAPTTTGNYRLRATSPAIDAGNNLSVTTSTDLDNNPRIVGGTVDMGAYEAAPSLSITKSVSPTNNVLYHGVVTYTIVLSNTGAVSDTNVILTDTLPAGVDFGQWLEHPVSGSLIRSGKAITWTGVITQNTALTLTLTATNISGYGDVVINSAYFSGTLQKANATAAFTTESFLLTHTLTVAVQGNGTVLPAVGTHVYDEKTVVTLTATPDDGWRFAEWGGDATGTLTQTTVTMDADKTVTATFTEMTACTPITNVDLTLQTASDIYTDTHVQLRADITPTNASMPYSYTVDYGDGSGDPITSSDNPLIWGYTWPATGTYTVEIAVWNCGMTAAQTDTVQVTIIEKPVVVPTHTLTIAMAGTGSGVVTPTAGSSYSYEHGETVWLTATATPGSTFTGWDGDLSGTTNPISITMDSDKVVTATFELDVICTAITGITLTLQTTGDIYTDTLVQLRADIAPTNASMPYTYTVDYGDGIGHGDPKTGNDNPLIWSYIWPTPGIYTVEIAVWNCGMTIPQKDSVQVSIKKPDYKIFLPIVIRANP